MIRNWLAIAIIIVLTLTFVVLWDTPATNFNTSSSTEEENSKARQINTLHNSITRAYTESGKLDYIFKSAETRQFQVRKRPSAKDYMELTQPQLQLFDPKAPNPWTITSEEGKTTNNDSTITLWGNVRARQINEAGEITELQTPYLVVKPEKQFAETDKAVMLTSPTGETQAVGMKANLKTGIIRLLSRVRGIHESQQ